MDELEREYTILFNGITDALKQLERLKGSLIQLQQDAEESYLKRCCDGGPPPKRGDIVLLEQEIFTQCED